jgi:hypothetical protein
MSILDRRKRLLSERANRKRRGGDIENRAQERTMHNWYAMEVEAESRRQEYERERVVADRAAEAECSASGLGRFSGFRFFLPRFSLSSARSLVASGASAGNPKPAGC